MGEVTTVGVFLGKLRERLMGCEALRGVDVFTAEVDHITTGREAVVFAVEPVPGTWSFQTAPQQEVTESYTVEGRTWVVKAGGGEDVIKATRDRAVEIFGAVATEVVFCNTQTATVAATPHCRATLGVDDASLRTFSLKQYVGDGSRDARMLFTIDVRATFNP